MQSKFRTQQQKANLTLSISQTNNAKVSESNSKECKTLIARLKMIVTSGESKHQQLFERDPWTQDIEEIGSYFKVQLKGKTPPCVIRIKFEEGSPKDLKAYWSEEFREPGPEANHGFANPVSIKKLSLTNPTRVCSAEENRRVRIKNSASDAIHTRLALHLHDIVSGMPNHDYHQLQTRRPSIETTWTNGGCSNRDYRSDSTWRWYPTVERKER